MSAERGMKPSQSSSLIVAHGRKHLSRKLVIVDRIDQTLERFQRQIRIGKLRDNSGKTIFVGGFGIDQRFVVTSQPLRNGPGRVATELANSHFEQERVGRLAGGHRSQTACEFSILGQTRPGFERRGTGCLRCAVPFKNLNQGRFLGRSLSDNCIRSSVGISRHLRGRAV